METEMNYYLGILHEEINGRMDKLYALFKSEKSTFSSKDDDFINYLYGNVSSKANKKLNFI